MDSAQSWQRVTYSRGIGEAVTCTSRGYTVYTHTHVRCKTPRGRHTQTLGFLFPERFSKKSPLGLVYQHSPVVTRKESFCVAVPQAVMRCAPSANFKINTDGKQLLSQDPSIQSVLFWWVPSLLKAEETKTTGSALPAVEGILKITAQFRGTFTLHHDPHIYRGRRIPKSNCSSRPTSSMLNDLNELSICRPMGIQDVAPGSESRHEQTDSKTTLEYLLKGRGKKCHKRDVFSFAVLLRLPCL